MAKLPKLAIEFGPFPGMVWHGMAWHGKACRVSTYVLYISCTIGKSQGSGASIALCAALAGARNGNTTHHI